MSVQDDINKNVMGFGHNLSRASLGRPSSNLGHVLHGVHGPVVNLYDRIKPSKPLPYRIFNPRQRVTVPTVNKVTVERVRARGLAIVEQVRTSLKPPVR